MCPGSQGGLSSRNTVWNIHAPIDRLRFEPRLRGPVFLGTVLLREVKGQTIGLAGRMAVFGWSGQE
jgi:hypothetical protein